MRSFARAHQICHHILAPHRKLSMSTVMVTSTSLNKTLRNPLNVHVPSLSSRPPSGIPINFRSAQASWLLLKDSRFENQIPDLISTLRSEYHRLDLEEREIALKSLVNGCGVTFDQISDARSFLSNQPPLDQLKQLQELRQKLTPGYEEMFQIITAHSGGLKFLIDLRQDLLGITRAAKFQDLTLKALSDDLRSLFTKSFSSSMLEFQALTWDNAASLLEYVASHEAVHRMRSVRDLKTRMGPNRRIFALFHPNMPVEPLVFIEVALLTDIASSIQSVLGGQDTDISETDTTTAIFYSICATQRGLSGIDLGAQLIRRVASRLETQFPNLTTFCTLSPIIFFRSWLQKKLKSDPNLLTLKEQGDIIKIFPDAKTLADASTAFQSLISDDAMMPSKTLHPLIWTNSDIFKPILMRLCFVYLTEEKKKGKAFDPVANFHLSNGAILEQLNWMGDITKKGFEQSCGIMANYNYILEDTKENKLFYAQHGSVKTGKRIEEVMRQ